MDRRPSNIPGYIHPETTTVTKGSQYKTFTEGERPKKREKFGTTDVGNKYASIDIDQEPDLTKEELEKQRRKFDMDNLSSKS